MEAFSALQQALPLSLRRRFEWVGGYVSEYVADVEQAVADDARLSVRQVQVMKLVMYAWMLDHFMRDGSHAAEVAVDEFARLQVPGFQVGGSLFAGRNDEVMLGRTLADELRSSQHLRPILDRLDGARTPHHALTRIYHEVKRGRQ